ncbi:MAG: efflux RND transporter periplasmic adaptor subunit [Pseudomonadota bacterium]
MRFRLSQPCLASAFALFFVMVGTNSGAAAPPGPGGARRPVVTVQVVTDEEVNPPTEYVGRVEAIQAVDLRARVQGFLDAVAFKEGASVSAGDTLYRIEQTVYKAKVNEAGAKVTASRAALNKSQQYLKRLQSVYAGGVSEADLESAVSTEQQAKAQLQENLASLELAELNLGYTTITAPIGGRIGRSAYTRGNLVGPESGVLARIVQTDPIRVVYSMSENELVATRVAEREIGADSVDCRLVPRIQLAGDGMYPLAGRLDFVDNEIDAATGTIAVRAVFDNPDGILLPGQYVSVFVTCREGKRLPMVPQSAVLADREGRYVFVVDAGGKVQQRRITTGPVLDTRWAVSSGLIPGETIIVQGIQKVKPGQEVDVVHAADGKK